MITIAVLSLGYILGVASVFGFIYLVVHNWDGEV
jgi:hypothetical protein